MKKLIIFLHSLLFTHFTELEKIADAFPFFTVTPYITGNPMSMVGVAGGNATFNCSAIGFPVPTIVWMKGGEVLDEEGRRVTFGTFQEGLTYWSVITVRELTLADAGRFQCKAMNVLAQSGLSSVAYLDIQCE